MGLPEGTVTFLFTDLEGSTRLWEAHPQEMRDALARHNTIVRAAVESHNGVVFSTMGDGMAAVFDSARDAVSGVLLAQLELTAADWGEVTGPLAARMGLLTDEGVLGGEHYLNQPLNRCARLMAAGHGGQALISGATELLVRDDMPEGCGLLDLGEHRLRDLARPVRIFQLTAPGLRGEFPPLRSLDAFAGNLPIQLSSFVGRVDELGELVTAVRRSALVTVAGVGGVGKTRLALQAAAELLPSYRDGAWLCELHAADDGEAMAQAVLAALRVRPRPGLTLAESIVEFLRSRNVLLVLDNCEHLVRAAAALAADILRNCRDVRILATSRQALGVDGEQVFGLRPLSLPAPSPAASMTTISGSDAVSLFVQRATAARGDFGLTAANVSAIGEICRRLDGVPLAIELAAARVAALRPAEIARLLDERFRLLTRGRADAAGRHQTLQATVEWSYALLSETERHVFNCLGVFPASFDAAGAAAVAGAGDLGQWDILDALTALVGKSMVAEEEGADQTSRYRLLETMRAYARQQLAAAGGQDLVQRRHAEHYAAFAEQAGPGLLGPQQLSWQRQIQGELDNLQAAVTWTFTGDQTGQFAFRIVAALAFSAVFGRSAVGAWAERALAEARTCSPETRASVIAAAGWSAFWGRRPPARAASGRGRHSRTCIRRSDQLRAAASPAFPDVRINRATGTRGQHRHRGPGVRGTGQPSGRRTSPCHGGDGLGCRRKPRGGAAARHGGGRGSSPGQKPGAVGDGLLRSCSRGMGRGPEERPDVRRGQPGPDPRRSLRQHPRLRPVAGCRHPHPQRRLARRPGRAPGSDRAGTRRRQPAGPRRHPPARRSCASPARRARTSGDPRRRRLGPFRGYQRQRTPRH